MQPLLCWRGYLHHRYLLWNDNDVLTITPKLPLIEYLDFGIVEKQLEDFLNGGSLHWDTYYLGLANLRRLPSFWRVKPLLVLVLMKFPVIVEVLADIYRTHLQDGLGSLEVQVMPLRSMRSFTKCRQAPFTDPLAIGKPSRNIRHSAPTLVPL